MRRGSGADPAVEIAAWQWRQIVNGATDTAIITTDPNGGVTSWNKGAAIILGWDEAEMLGKSRSRIFAEEGQQAQLSREIDDAASVGKGGGEEGWRLRKDGSRFWAVGELSPRRITRRGFYQNLVLNSLWRLICTSLHRSSRTPAWSSQVRNSAPYSITSSTTPERATLYTLSGAPMEAFSMDQRPCACLSGSRGSTCCSPT